jgi:rubredoxin
MKKYVCPCGYEYDPKVGEPSRGIAPGTPWEEVAESFECPICGLGKDAFEEE